MNEDKRVRSAAALLLALSLAGCGGGGGGSPAPPPPLITAQSFAATEDTDLTASVATRVGSNATVAVTTNPTRGTLTSFANSGAFTYRPNANLNGADSFVVEATDGANNRLSATISVNVAAVNDVPVAVSEISEVAFAPTLTLNVLSNDSDVDDANLSVVLYESTNTRDEPNPPLGTATVDANNRILLNLPANFRGVSRVHYLVRDSAGLQSAVATAVVFVDSPQFDVWFVAPNATNQMSLLVSDLAQTRQTMSVAPPRAINGVKISRAKNVVVLAESEAGITRVLWAMATQGVQTPVPLTPALGTNQFVEQFAVSPDGSRAAYELVDAGERQVWLVEIANPAGRVRVPMPVGTADLLGLEPLSFSPNSSGLYFVAADGNGSDRLVRASISNPTQPVTLYPLTGESGNVFGFYPAPDDSYVVTRNDNLYWVSVADPTVRTVINAPLPAGQLMNAQLADATATRFVYQRTSSSNLTGWSDDTLWATDIGTPGHSTLILGVDAQRTGPIGLLSFRPDRNAVLINLWSAVGNEYQVNLDQLSVNPADGIARGLNDAVPPQGSTVVNDGFYIDNDTVMRISRENQQLSKVHEVREGVWQMATEMVEPGIRSLRPELSADKAVMGFTWTRNTVNDPNHYTMLVNRAAPTRMLQLTSAGSLITDMTVVALVERP